MIEISAHPSKLESFWAGEWLNTYTYSNGHLSGHIVIKNHYFESGNMQFNLDKSFDSIPLKDQSAKSIVDAIFKTEDKVSKSKK